MVREWMTAFTINWPQGSVLLVAKASDERMPSNVP